MTIGSEATIARELELRYAALCTLDNHAHGVRQQPVRQQDIQASATAQRRRLPGGAAARWLARLARDRRMTARRHPRTLLIRGARLLDARQELTGDLLIEDGRIAAFGPGAGASAAAAAVDQVIDGRGRAVIPGFVNTHTHAAMVLFRGYTDDVPLRQWLEEKIWPLERHLTAEHVRAGAALAGLEMLSLGHHRLPRHVLPAPGHGRRGRAAGHAGGDLPGVLRGVRASGRWPRSSAELEAEHRAPAPASATWCPRWGRTPPTPCRWRGWPWPTGWPSGWTCWCTFTWPRPSTRCRSSAASTARIWCQALDAVGFLGPRLVAAHGIWLTDDDARLLASRGVTISHCPASNMKLGSGWSAGRGPGAALPVAARGPGCGWRWGPTGPPSNNNLDMFETMKLAALLQKHTTGDPAALTAHEAFAMATAGGAEALRTDAGLLEVGPPRRPGAGRSRPPLPGARSRPDRRPGLRRPPRLRRHGASSRARWCCAAGATRTRRRSWPTPGRRSPTCWRGPRRCHRPAAAGA